MTLRTRLTVAVAILVAAAIALTGWYLVDTAERELVEEVDAFLVDRADRLVPVEALRRSRTPPEVRAFGEGRFSEDDAIAQVVDEDGAVFSLTETVIPISADDVAIAASDRALRTIKTVEIEGEEFRVLTASLGRADLALMVGRDLREVNAALDGLTRRTVVAGVVGAALAALVAWVLVTRLSRPVKQLTDAAEHVAATQDLEAAIDVERSDEVGRLASAFNTMLGALDTSRRQQQRLVMDASHELRTPLTSIRTNVDLLRRARTLDDTERNDVLDDVSRELDELSTLVAELVELSTSSRRPSEPAVDVDLGRVAQAAALRAQRRFGRDIEVVAFGDTIVRGHASLLERAVWNLVDNAVKFSPDGPVKVSVDGRRVSVRDHGPGVSEEDRELIFDRFYRSVATRSAPGSGLGLSIVADIVATHGGSCFVDDPDEGPGVVIGFEVTGVDVGGEPARA